MNGIKYRPIGVHSAVRLRFVSLLGIFLLLAFAADLRAQEGGYQSWSSGPRSTSISDSGIMHRLLSEPSESESSALTDDQSNHTRRIQNDMRAPLRPEQAIRPEQEVRHAQELRHAHELRHEQILRSEPVLLSEQDLRPDGVVSPARYDQLNERDTGRHRNISQQSGEATQYRRASNESDSFIERERLAEPKEEESAKALVTKFGVNLAFVLVFAVGCIFLIKQWQTAKLGASANSGGKSKIIQVNQVLRLTNGASLHVVEVAANRFLVAIDSSGIKSVKALVHDFSETLDRSQAADLMKSSPKLEPIVHDETTAEIDDKLIKLLLKSAKQAA